MDLGNALRRTGREDIASRSIISNTIKDLYPRELEILSVNIRGKKIIIKTGNALINSELQLISGDIKKESLKRLSQIGISISPDIKIMFI